MSDNLITGEVRFSYVSVFETNKNGKYSVTLLIPKTDVTTVNAIKARIDTEIAKELNGKLKGVKPTNPYSIIHDGDGVKENGTSYGEECKGHWILNANSNDRPGVVDANRQQIFDKQDLYSGCYGRASLNFFAYENNGRRGVGCGLQNIQKYRDGENLTGRVAAEDEFLDNSVINQPIGQVYQAQVATPVYQPQAVDPINYAQPQVVSPVNVQPVQPTINNIYGVPGQ